MQTTAGLDAGIVMVPLLALIRLDLDPCFLLGFFLSPRLAGFFDRGRTRSDVLIFAAISALLLIWKSPISCL